MKRSDSVLALLIVCALPATAAASAPTAVTATDTPNDSGESIDVSWKDSDAGATAYEVLWSENTNAAPAVKPPKGAPKAEIKASKDPTKHWQLLSSELPGEQRKGFSGTERGTDYYFKVVAVSPQGRFESAVVGPVQSSAQWFNTDKTWIAIIGAVICFFVIFFIQWMKRGKELFIRKLAGLEAVDEAVGRATEMGRPVLFIPGIMDMDNVQTLAGLTMLAYVTKTIAEYDTKLDVPVSRSLVMTAGREIVKQAYLEAGTPDAYNENIVHYLTDEQFGYVAGVNGIIVRDQPATCIYMGAFFAESLILAETGNSIGAIQIAGTAMPSQLPFFVAACDYTLMGEELFAASAYLSGDPRQLGSLKGQDMGKIIVMAAIVVGAVAATLAQVPALEFMGGVQQWLVSVFA